MTFRTRLLVSFLLAVLLPMIVLALLIRNEMTGRLTSQYEGRVDGLIRVIEDDLALESEAITASLGALRKALTADNRFWRAAVDHVEDERRYLLDYAGNAMALTGVSMLQIQDEEGRILSSGHFRNEYDRLDPALPRLLEATPRGMALVRARAPDTPFLALARIDSVRMGDRRFTFVAGSRVERRFLSSLARDGELTVTLTYPGGTLRSAPEDGERANDESGTDDAIVRELAVPFIDSQRGELAEARFRVRHDLAALHALRSSVDRWFLVAVAAAAVLSVLVVVWLASRISRPLMELADKTSRLDLDRLDVDFATPRKDEFGMLSRLLGAMTQRLRASAGRIREAERRATLGELARQVNHDIKNGLTPIRNVFHHLTELGRSKPGDLPDVLAERKRTIDSSISYLENLASNYARLSPRIARRPCDVGDIVRQVVADLERSDRPIHLKTSLGEGTVILGDPVSLRRVLDNLVSNAIDSIGPRAGSVTISAARAPGEDHEPRVRITVVDTGEGMSREQQARAFDDFFTTKDDGTGLGLSIVRRLVMDLDGSIHLESRVGHGSRFTIDLPAAGTG